MLILFVFLVNSIKTKYIFIGKPSGKGLTEFENNFANSPDFKYLVENVYLLTHSFD